MANLLSLSAHTHKMKEHVCVRSRGGSHMLSIWNVICWDSYVIYTWVYFCTTCDLGFRLQSSFLFNMKAMITSCCSYLWNTPVKQYVMCVITVPKLRATLCRSTKWNNCWINGIITTDCHDTSLNKQKINNNYHHSHTIANTQLWVQVINGDTTLDI